MIGKITAVVFMIKFYNGVWNTLYTSDQWEYQRKNVYVKMILNVTGSYKEEDELYWMIIEQYSTALVMSILIAVNV